MNNALLSQCVICVFLGLHPARNMEKMACNDYWQLPRTVISYVHFALQPNLVLEYCHFAVQCLFCRPGKHRKTYHFLFGNWIAVFRGFKLMDIHTASCFPGSWISTTKMPKDIFCWLQVLRYLSFRCPTIYCYFFFAKLLDEILVWRCMSSLCEFSCGCWTHLDLNKRILRRMQCTSWRTKRAELKM